MLVNRIIVVLSFAAALRIVAADVAALPEATRRELSEARTICAELGEIVPKLEAERKGQYSRMQYEVIRYSLDAIEKHELPRGRTNRVVREVRELMTFAPQALARAKRIAAGDERDLAVPRFKLGPVRSRGPILFGSREWPDGRIERNESVMLTGWGHWGNTTRYLGRLNRMGFNYQAIEVLFRELRPQPAVTNRGAMAGFDHAVREAAKHDTLVNLHLGIHYAPPWVTELSEDSTRCHNSWMHFCVHDPAITNELAKAAALTASLAKDRPALSSFCLTNEPANDDTSKCSGMRRIFSAWLKAKFGTVAALNAAWGTQYADFDAVEMAAYPKLPKTPAALEFVRCERSYYADFHQTLVDAVHAAAPGVPTHSKAVMECAFLSPQYGAFWSIDPVRFAGMFDWLDLDPVAFYAYDEKSLYANDWAKNQAAYDYLRSFADKPLINGENHNIIDFSFAEVPAAHVYSALWQNAMHGQRATALWTWERGKGEKDIFNGLAPEHPNCLEALGRCSLDLQRLSDEIAPIQVQKPTVLVLCSLTSQVLGDNNFLMGYMGASFLGEPVGVVTDDVLARFADDGEMRRPLASAKLVLLPSVTHLPRKALDGLKRLEKTGVRIVVAGKAPQFDDCGKPLADVPWKSACSVYENDIHKLLTADLSLFPKRPRACDPKDADKTLFGVETHGYVRKGFRYLALCNHLRRQVAVDVGDAGIDLISGRTTGRLVTLDPMMPVFIKMEGEK